MNFRKHFCFHTKTESSKIFSFLSLSFFLSKNLKTDILFNSFPCKYGFGLGKAYGLLWSSHDFRKHQALNMGWAQSRHSCVFGCSPSRSTKHSLHKAMPHAARVSLVQGVSLESFVVQYLTAVGQTRQSCCFPISIQQHLGLGPSSFTRFFLETSRGWK